MPLSGLAARPFAHLSQEETDRSQGRRDLVRANPLVITMLRNVSWQATHHILPLFYITAAAGLRAIINSPLTYRTSILARSILLVSGDVALFWRTSWKMDIPFVPFAFAYNWLARGTKQTITSTDRLRGVIFSFLQKTAHLSALRRIDGHRGFFLMFELAVHRHSDDKPACQHQTTDARRTRSE